LGLGTRQQHAKVERPQKLVFADLLAPLHHLLVHDGDLAGRAAEADESQLGSEPERIFEEYGLISSLHNYSPLRNMNWHIGFRHDKNG
jgi:hypothetical protein